MALTDREKRYLVAAFQLNEGLDFDPLEAGTRAGFPAQEAEDLATILERKELIEALTFGGGETAILSIDGREQARALIAEAEQAKVAPTGVSTIKKAEAPAPFPNEPKEQPDDRVGAFVAEALTNQAAERLKGIVAALSDAERFYLLALEHLGDSLSVKIPWPDIRRFIPEPDKDVLTSLKRKRLLAQMPSRPFHWKLTSDALPLVPFLKQWVEDRAKARKELEEGEQEPINVRRTSPEQEAAMTVEGKKNVKKVREEQRVKGKGKNEEGDADQHHVKLPKWLGYLWELLRESAKVVPVNRFAIGVVGLAAAVGLILLILKDPAKAVFGILLLAAGMVLLMFLGWVQQHGGKTARFVVPPFIVFVMIMVCLTIVMLFTQYFFDFPKKVSKPSTNDRIASSDRHPNVLKVPPPDFAILQVLPAVKKAIEEHRFLPAWESHPELYRAGNTIKRDKQNTSVYSSFGTIHRTNLNTGASSLVLRTRADGSSVAAKWESIHYEELSDYNDYVDKKPKATSDTTYGLVVAALIIGGLRIEERNADGTVSAYYEPGVPVAIAHSEY